MCDQNLLLVACVEKFPCLYNFNLQEYSKKDITEKAWNEVANQVALSVTDCKEKWRNLRYSLLRSLKPNTDGSQKKKYYLHKSMEFIKPFIKSSKGSLITQFDLEDDDDTSTHQLNQDPMSPQHQLFDYELYTEPATKRKRHLENFHTVKNIQNVPENTDSRKLFMLGLMPEINALSEVQIKIFRRKVLMLLDEIAEDSNALNDDNSVGFRTTQVKPEPTEGGDDIETVYFIK